MTTLTLVNLTKEYVTGETAVSDLALTVNDGELNVLLGPSGCGKTTTLRLIAGLLRPTNGDVLFDNQSVLSVPPEKRGAVMVFQEHALFPFMSVGDNVAYGLKMQKMSQVVIQERVSAALTAVHLSGYEKRRPNQLSGGEKQRVSLARALAVRPRLLLLDEPLSNLDRGLRKELRQMVRTLQKEAGITTLFVTHDQAEAVGIADRIGVMINGRLRQVGHPRDFFERPADSQIARFFGADNFISGIKRGQCVETTQGDVEILESAVADGPVTLTIRPEAIEIGANGHNNNFPACVLSFSYQIPVSRCRVMTNGVNLHLTASSFSNLDTSDKIVVHLPRERICVLPLMKEG